MVIILSDKSLKDAEQRSSKVNTRYILLAMCGYQGLQLCYLVMDLSEIR